MKREQVLAIAKAHQTELRNLGVKSLELFGLVAREEAPPDGDADFLVEFAIEASLDLFRVRHYLEDLLGYDVDLGTIDALREHLHQPILIANYSTSYLKRLAPNSITFEFSCSILI